MRLWHKKTQTHKRISEFWLGDLDVRPTGELSGFFSLFYLEPKLLGFAEKLVDCESFGLSKYAKYNLNEFRLLIQFKKI